MATTLDDASLDLIFRAARTIGWWFTLGHGDPATIFERLPRLAFEEATTIV